MAEAVMGIHILDPDAPPPLNAIFVDTRRRMSYGRGHIPGAVHVAWEEWCEPAPREAGDVLAQPGYWGVLAAKTPDEYGRRLEAHGISSDRALVVYSGGARSRGREGRVAWMLLYLGAHQVYLLDGGWRLWVERGGEIEVGPPPSPLSGTFDIRLQPERRATIDAVHREYTEGRTPVLVDTRSRLEYVGEVDEYLPRRGHLPGARLVPFAHLFDESDRYVAPEQYHHILPIEVASAPELVAYCEVGVRASLFALLHEIYTTRTVRVFDGSLMQWSLNPTLPVLTGPAVS